MSDALAKSYPGRRVPTWHRRWLILARLYPEMGAEYPSLLGLWLRRRAAFWHYVLGVEEWRLVREAVKRGNACASGPPVVVPPVRGWLDR